MTTSVIDGRAILQQDDDFKPATVNLDSDLLDFDLGNLLLSSAVSLQRAHKDEQKLLESSRDHVQLLVNTLFTRPSQPIRDEVGRLIQLPEPELPVPREKPLPKAKAQTKWEKFAKTKGIVKRKRGRMVWDEEQQGWAPRYGYQRANDEQRQWLVEHRDGDDSKEDPWANMKKEKKERVAKQEKQRLANLKAAGGRTVPGQIDLSSAIKPKPGKRNQRLKEQRENAQAQAGGSGAAAGLGKGLGKRKREDAEHLKVSLKVAQASTASMGKFEAYRKNEPARPDSGKRQRQSKLVAGQSVREERDKSLQLLNKVLGD